jgi:hypothetical protein
MKRKFSIIPELAKKAKSMSIEKSVIEAFKVWGRTFCFAARSVPI